MKLFFDRKRAVLQILNLHATIVKYFVMLVPEQNQISLNDDPQKRRSIPIHWDNAVCDVLNTCTYAFVLALYQFDFIFGYPCFEYFSKDKIYSIRNAWKRPYSVEILRLARGPCCFDIIFVVRSNRQHVFNVQHIVSHKTNENYLQKYRSSHSEFTLVPFLVAYMKT